MRHLGAQLVLTSIFFLKFVLGVEKKVTCIMPFVQLNF